MKHLQYLNLNGDTKLQSLPESHLQATSIMINHCFTLQLQILHNIMFFLPY